MFRFKKGVGKVKDRDTNEWVPIPALTNGLQLSKDDIVQSVESAATDKVPSAAVTHQLQGFIDDINENALKALGAISGVYDFNDFPSGMRFIGNIAYAQNAPYEDNATGICITSKRGGNAKAYDTQLFVSQRGNKYRLYGPDGQWSEWVELNVFNIVQNTESSAADKIPSAAVTHALNDLYTELKNNVQSPEAIMDFNDMSRLAVGGYALYRVGPAAKNAPAPAASNNGVMLVYKPGDDWIYQWFFVGSQDADIYNRAKFNGSWRGWTKVVSGSINGSGGFQNASIDTSQPHVCDYYRVGNMVTVVYDFYFTAGDKDTVLIVSGLPKAQKDTIPALTKDGGSEYASAYVNGYGGLYKYYRPMSNGRYNGTFSYICTD